MTLGQMWAVYLILGGLSLLINGEEFRHMVKELKHNHFAVILAGFMSLLIGLLSVFSHNVWEGWAVIVTLLGWAALLKGAFIVLLPKQAMGMVHLWKNKTMLMGGGVAWLILGVVLGFLAF